ncbi:hypothetical protein ACFQ0G_53455 [Streptomyces chiangmaiensis]
MLRPVIDPDHSAAEGLTEDEQLLLMVTARDHHQPAAYRPRAYALLLTLYTVCLRVDSSSPPALRTSATTAATTCSTCASRVAPARRSRCRRSPTTR